MLAVLKNTFRILLQGRFKDAWLYYDFFRNSEPLDKRRGEFQDFTDEDFEVYYPEDSTDYQGGLNAKGKT